jgi:hypothetical protein
MKTKVFRLKKSARRLGFPGRRFISMCGSKKESKNKLAPAHGCRKSTIVQQNHCAPPLKNTMNDQAKNRTGIAFPLNVCLLITC